MLHGPSSRDADAWIHGQHATDNVLGCRSFVRSFINKNKLGHLTLAGSLYRSLVVLEYVPSSEMVFHGLSGKRYLPLLMALKIVVSFVSSNGRAPANLNRRVFHVSQ